MGMLKEFKEFAMKGNIVDLAVAVVIGAAFGKIVTALTDSVIMPLVSLVLGKGGVKDISFSIGSTLFPIGTFLQAVVDFVLIAWVLFLVIKAINVVSKKKAVVEEAPAPPSSTDQLLIEIRDSLQNKS